MNISTIANNILVHTVSQCSSQHTYLLHVIKKAHFMSTIIKGMQFKT